MAAKSSLNSTNYRGHHANKGKLFSQAEGRGENLGRLRVGPRRNFAIVRDFYFSMAGLAVLGEFSSTEACARFPVYETGPHAIWPFLRLRVCQLVFELALHAARS